MSGGDNTRANSGIKIHAKSDVYISTEFMAFASSVITVIIDFAASSDIKILVLGEFVVRFIVVLLLTVYSDLSKVIVG
jgi:hypothetical protein